MHQLDLLEPVAPAWGLADSYVPVLPTQFAFERIVLARGSLDTPERRSFANRICDIYPNAAVEKRLETSHSQVPFLEEDPLKRLARGKRTLVLGTIEPTNAVWRYEPRCEVYGHEWCFSVYGSCPFNCAYCYLPGVPAIWFSPGVRIYVNLDKILSQIDALATAARKPTRFFLGTLQDGLALDSLTAYSSVLVPFFAAHRNARLFIQTKASDVQRLLAMAHNGHTVLSWTLTPREIARRFEADAPTPDARIEAMTQCSEKGYRTSVNLVPLIPYGEWEDAYAELVEEVFARVPVRQIVLGGLCMKQRAYDLMRRRIGKENPLLRHLIHKQDNGGEGRILYRPGMFDSLLRSVFAICRKRGPCRVVFGRRLGGTYAICFDGWSVR